MSNSDGSRDKGEIGDNKKGRVESFFSYSFAIKGNKTEVLYGERNGTKKSF